MNEDIKNITTENNAEAEVQENQTAEPILKVENLGQYFKMGNRVFKAVDDVSFNINKGEVFGIVGESGCGKTTTGRSIIKLYDATKGNVYLNGQRIVAGTRQYREDIVLKRKETAEKIAELKKSDNPNANELINEYNLAKKRFIVEKKQQIKSAIDDHKNCNKKYSKTLLANIEQEYNPQIKKLEDKLGSFDKNSSEYAETNQELSKVLKEKRHKSKIAKKTKLITQIQMIFQDPVASLNPRMTVRDIIAEGLVINGYRDKKYIDEKVYEILEKVGLVREHAGRYPHEFSGGQRQRIGIARSVIMNPEIIIADEPVSALDVSIQAQVITLLNEIRKTLGLTIIFIAHDISVVKYFSDKIAVMYFGKIMELASSDELFASPFHPYTKALLSAIPLPDPEYEKTRKRIIYNPLADHDYSVNKPELKEITKGHFVYCNDEEFERYKKEIENK